MCILLNLFHFIAVILQLWVVQLCDSGSTTMTFFTYNTRKREIAKALQLKGHSDFAPIDLAYYQHFLFFLFENIAFWKVLRGNHKCRSRGATPLVNNKLESMQLQKHCISNAERHCARHSGFFGLVWFENIVFGRFAKCAWQPPREFRVNTDSLHICLVLYLFTESVTWWPMAWPTFLWLLRPHSNVVR